MLGRDLGREELPKKTRSMLNLAMISALNRPHELKAHIKGALVNGVSVVEIREVLLQVAIYCGVPAAVDSFRIAREVFAEQKRKHPRRSDSRTKGKMNVARLPFTLFRVKGGLQRQQQLAGPIKLAGATGDALAEGYSRWR